MSLVTPQKVKELRERTQAGFLDCKKALEESNGDLEKAVIWLREKGMSKANKKADAVAAEGITKVAVEGDLCLMLEVNSQTDFVAQNAEFIKYTDEVVAAILKSKKTQPEEVNKLVLKSGKDVATTALELTAKIGEKISFRRAELFEKKSNQTFGIYQHFNNRVSSMVLVEGEMSSEDAKGIAMHLAAMNPKFINESQVDQSWLNQEKEILIKKTMDEGKPKEFAEKIVAGRLNKIVAEVSLEAQDFVKEPGTTVGNYLKNKKSVLKSMLRYELGEGIEKIQSNFADEVAAQMNN